MKQKLARYQQILNLQGSHLFSLIEHEEAMVATVYRVGLSSGQNYILKICSRAGDYRREAYFLTYFSGKIPVPRIIQLIESSEDIDGAILMQCLEGKLLENRQIDTKLAYEIGVILGTIHAERCSGYGDLTQELYSNPRIPFTLKFQEGLEECQNHLPATTMEQCSSLFAKYLPLLNGIDGPCICHRDFRPGNLIVSNGLLQGVIDWSSARSSFAEEDFCPMALGEWSLSHTYKEDLLAGYASIRPVPHYEGVMPLLVLSKAIGVIGFTVKRQTWDGIHAHLYQRHRHFLEELLKQF